MNTGLEDILSALPCDAIERLCDIYYKKECRGVYDHTWHSEYKEKFEGIMDNIHTFVREKKDELECLYNEYRTYSEERRIYQNEHYKELYKYASEIKVVITTASDLEFAVLHKYFLKPLKEYGNDKIIKIQLDDIVYYIGRIGNSKVIHVESRIGSATDGGTMDVMRTIDNVLEPMVILSVGIAYGNNYKEQKIGDVLIPESIRPIGSGDKLTDKGIKFKNSWGMNTPKYISNRIRTAERYNKKFSVYKGLLLTADDVIDGIKIREDNFKKCTDAIGGEMESYGIYKVANECGMFFGMIKGICDWGAGKNFIIPNEELDDIDTEKTDVVKDMLQLYAMKNACLLLEDLLMDKYVFSDTELYERRRSISKNYADERDREMNKKKQTQRIYEFKTWLTGKIKVLVPLFLLFTVVMIIETINRTDRLSQSMSVFALILSAIIMTYIIKNIILDIKPSRNTLPESKISCEIIELNERNFRLRIKNEGNEIKCFKINKINFKYEDFINDMLLKGDELFLCSKLEKGDSVVLDLYSSVKHTSKFRLNMEEFLLKNDTEPVKVFLSGEFELSNEDARNVEIQLIISASYYSATIV